MLKITRAYCIEFNEIFSIEDAYAHSKAQGFIRLNFLCSDEKCRQKGIRVTGVNFDKEPHNRNREMHFRLQDEHLPTCIWEEYKQSILSNTIRENETLENAKIRRQVYLELDEIVETFNPKFDDFLDINIENKSNKSNKSNDYDSKNYYKSKQTKYSQIESTSSFSCVCNNHYHRWKRYKEKMKDMVLNVNCVGKTNWFNYFQMIEYKLHNIPVGFQAITFGFLYPKLYGNGTKIYFQTSRNKPSIYIYISEEIKNKLKYKKEIIGILNHIDLLSDPAAYFIDYKVKPVKNKNGELEYEIIINPKYFWIACNN